MTSGSCGCVFLFTAGQDLDGSASVQDAAFFLSAGASGLSRMGRKGCKQLAIYSSSGNGQTRTGWC